MFTKRQPRQAKEALNSLSVPGLSFLHTATGIELPDEAPVDESWWLGGGGSSLRSVLLVVD